MALFAPFHILGCVTDKCPFVVSQRGRQNYVTLSAGNSWYTLDCDKLRTALVGIQYEGKIRCMAKRNNFLFCAVGKKIIVSKRVKRIGDVESGQVVQMMVLANILLAITLENELKYWEITFDGQLINEEVIQLGEEFTPLCMSHPDTYLNKVLVGSQEGGLQLWNFITKSLIHAFKGYDCPIRCLESSSALDVVCVGLEDGRAILLNIKYEDVVAEFRNAAGVGANTELIVDKRQALKVSNTYAACTCVAFGKAGGLPLMATGGSPGVIVVWNLKKKSLYTIIKDAHDGPLINFCWFSGEPVLMSSSEDNSLKQWVFDGHDVLPRLLRFRSGHAEPPTCIKYYKQGQFLLSGGNDRTFRVFCVYQDQLSRELSQGNIKRRSKKMKVDYKDLYLPRLIDMTSCEVRERDWCNVVTAHESDPIAYTWLLKNFNIGEHKLVPPKPIIKDFKNPKIQEPPAPVSVVTISCCGNFAFVGSASGRVDKYNIQSGQHRGTYCRGKNRALNAHKDRVTVIGTDDVNSFLITSGSDGKVRAWGFHNLKLQHTLKVGQGVASGDFHRGSGLMALALNNHDVYITDVQGVRVPTIVRRFQGHEDRVTRVQFSEDSRWLLSSSMDCTLRIWNVPSSTILQVIQLPSAAVCFTFSPQMDMLATCHSGLRGVCLWSNQSHFGSVVDLTPSSEPVEVELPYLLTTSRHLPGTKEQNGNLEQTQESEKQNTGVQMEVNINKVYEQIDQSGSPSGVAPNLMTLSLLPTTQWQNLAYLDIIQMRNKPKEPPKKPEVAPFFLPSVPNFQGSVKFELTEQEGDVLENNNARIIRKKSKDISEFEFQLSQCYKKKNYDPFVRYLRSLSPLKLERAVKELVPLEEEMEDLSQRECETIQQLFKFISQEIQQRRNYDFMVGFLSLVLRMLGKEVIQREQIRNAAWGVLKQLEDGWAGMGEQLQTCLCSVNWLSGIQG